jgi:hypothetical protein
VVEYKGRGWIYALIIAFFLVPYYINKYGYSNQRLAKTEVGDVVIYHYPMFIFGVILADLEMQPKRPLDWARNLSLPATILKNGILLFVFITYGSYKDDCHWHKSGPCTYWKIFGINSAIPRDVALYVAGISIIVLALTSHVT